MSLMLAKMFLRERGEIRRASEFFTKFGSVVEGKVKKVLCGRLFDRVCQLAGIVPLFRKLAQASRNVPRCAMHTFI